MEEIWKDIIGYEGLYQVSNIGRIKSLKRTYINKYGRRKTLSERIVTNKDNSKGYKFVILFNNNLQKSFYIHRLVAIHFLDFVPNKNEINHKNGIKSDNSVLNLEWCNRQENVSHSFKTKLRFGSKPMLNVKGINHPRFGLSGNKNGKSKQIKYKSKISGFEKNYESMNLASIDLNIPISIISRICNNKLKSSKHEFRYV